MSAGTFQDVRVDALTDSDCRGPSAAIRKMLLGNRSRFPSTQPLNISLPSSQAPGGLLVALRAPTSPASVKSASHRVSLGIRKP